MKNIQTKHSSEISRLRYEIDLLKDAIEKMERDEIESTYFGGDPVRFTVDSPHDIRVKIDLLIGRIEELKISQEYQQEMIKYREELSDYMQVLIEIRDGFFRNDPDQS